MDGRAKITILMIVILSLASPVAVASGLGGQDDKGGEDDPIVQPPTAPSEVPAPHAPTPEELLTAVPHVDPGSRDDQDDNGGNSGGGGMQTPQPGSGLPSAGCLLSLGCDPEPEQESPDQPSAPDAEPEESAQDASSRGAKVLEDASTAVAEARKAIDDAVQGAEQTAQSVQSTAHAFIVDAVQAATFVYEQTSAVTERQVQELGRMADAALAFIEEILLAALPNTQASMNTGNDDGLEPSGAQVGAPMAAGYMALGIAAVGGFGVLLVTFAAMRRLLSIGSVGLLSRIPSKDIMKNDTRASIHDIVESDPGVSLNEIVSRLGLSRNAVAYHLAVFESEKQVVSVKDGKYRRYFINGGKYVNGAKDVVSAIKNDVTRDVISYILEHPGTMQKDVCAAVGTSPSATNWHINRLQKVGLVEKEKVANTVRYTPGPSMMKYDLQEFGLATPANTDVPQAPADAFVHA